MSAFQPPPRHPRSLAQERKRDYVRLSPSPSPSVHARRPSLNDAPDNTLTEFPVPSHHDTLPILAFEEADSPTAPPDQRPIGSRRRSASSISLASFVTDASTDEEGEEAAVRQASAILEDLELQDFLARSSKYLKEVRQEAFMDPDAVVPSTKRFTSADGKVDYAAYLSAYARSTAERVLPRDMLLDSGRPQKFSITSSATRASVERLYISASPRDLSKACRNIRKIYMWEDTSMTGCLALLYTVCWAYDIVPALLFGIPLYTILRRWLHPPTASVIRQEIKEQKARMREANQLSKDLNARAELGFLGSSLLSTVNNASIMAGSFAATSPKRTVSSSSVPDTSQESAPDSKEKNSGVFSLARDLLARFGDDIQIAMDDSTDLIEKAKNYALWRIPEATSRLLCLHSLIFCFLLVASSKTIMKILYAYLGMAFFAFFRLQDRYPRFRRAFNPLFYLLWAAPTDADVVIYLIRKRNEQGRSLSARDFRKRKSKQTSVDLDSTSLFSPPDTSPKSTFQKVKSRFPFKRSKAGESDPFSDTATLLDEQLPTDYFAFHKSIPGNLRLEGSALYFDAMKGFHGLSQSLGEVINFRDKLLSPSSPAPSASETSASPRKRTILTVPLQTITGVKKHQGQREGAGLTLLRSGDAPALKFVQVSKRDELFAMLLSGSADWKRV